MKKTLAAGLGAAFTLGSLMGTGTANATPPCQVNWELKSDGVCHPYYSTPTNGYDPYGPSPESVGIQGADVCGWRVKGISETDIVDHIVSTNPGMITPNVEDWVREAEENNCPEKLIELARRPSW